MNINYCRESNVLRIDGVPALYYSVGVPQIETNEDIGAFYRELSKKCVDWARTLLFDRVRDEYERSDDERKRFRFGYSYLVDIRAFFVDNGRFLSAVSCVSLKRKNEKNKITEHKTAQVWRTSDGTLLPLRAFVGQKKERDFFRNGGKSFYIRDDKEGIIAVNVENDMMLTQR